jgi:two-component system nitrogen regulation response regulator GlnG/two-component system response regulator HydG
LIDETTLDISSSGQGSREARARELPSLVLVLLWSAREPSRAGEVLAVPSGLKGPCVFGRGEPGEDDRYARAMLVRQRPSVTTPGAKLADPFVSRTHWKLAREGDTLLVENLGRRALVVSGAEVDRAAVREGDVVAIAGCLTFLCMRRAPPAPLRMPLAEHPFGEADPYGVVGESLAAWALRDEIAFTGPRLGHVLVSGPSGAGKELVARAIHARSRRAGKRLVARNAATIPPGLVDAELFGNIANYPNPGMPERPGLVGEADGGTLLLDEIGEMPLEAQAHLLRTLDAGGEYQRLGDAKPRTSDLRLIAATNRDGEALKHDVLARLGLRIRVPGLNERREDVPLLVRHMLKVEAARDPHVGEAFFAGWDGRAGEPRVASELVVTLARHAYGTHARELSALLWRALASSKGDTIELTDAVRAELSLPESESEGDGKRAPDEVTADEVRAALAKHRGVRERAWRELGLASRHVLGRLMKRYGIDDGDQ